MDKIKQRIAIAEACPSLFRCCRCDEKATLIKYLAPFCSELCAESAGDFALDNGQQGIPDFCSDLNAMQEAEKVLTNEQWELFCDELLWSKNKKEHSAYTACRVGLSATTAQRAEAFLRTLNLWKES